MGRCARRGAAEGGSARPALAGEPGRGSLDDLNHVPYGACMFAPHALHLNLDDSFDSTGAMACLDLRHWQTRLRYATTLKTLLAFAEDVGPQLGDSSVRFLGSGDFHHLTYALLRVRPPTPIQVVVFDNHPDNMFFPWGIHCGSWVFHAARLPAVAAVTVVGITSADLSGANLLQHHYGVLRQGKVHYVCLRPLPWLFRRLAGGSAARDASAAPDRVPALLAQHVERIGLPVYLSVDKDVLARECVPSTWDQGVMSEALLGACVEALAGRVVAADVCGDLSSSRAARWTSRCWRLLDGAAPLPADLDPARAKHRELNLRLAQRLAPADPTRRRP